MNGSGGWASVRFAESRTAAPLSVSLRVSPRSGQLAPLVAYLGGPKNHRFPESHQTTEFEASGGASLVGKAGLGGSGER